MFVGELDMFVGELYWDWTAHRWALTVTQLADALCPLAKVYAIENLLEQGRKNQTKPEPYLKPQTPWSIWWYYSVTRAIMSTSWHFSKKTWNFFKKDPRNENLSYAIVHFVPDVNWSDVYAGIWDQLCHVKIHRHYKQTRKSSPRKMFFPRKIQRMSNLSHNPNR